MFNFTLTTFGAIILIECNQIDRRASAQMKYLNFSNWICMLALIRTSMRHKPLDRMARIAKIGMCSETPVGVLSAASALLVMACAMARQGDCRNKGVTGKRASMTAL